MPLCLLSELCLSKVMWMVLQGEEDALPRDIHALKMQATHTFGSNRIFAASDFFTYQVQIPLLATLLAIRPYAYIHCNGCFTHFCRA